MATWHQNQGGRLVGLYTPHETMWKIIENPPNDCAAVGLFHNRTAAEINKAGLGKHHPELRGHVHLIPPLTERPQ